MHRVSAAGVLVGTVLVGSLGSCGGSDYSNGTCICPASAKCDLKCQAPPCHVDCAQGSSCTGTCANGQCTCERGASCAFSCAAPPCHVTCDGANPSCNGTCSNGTCACGENSTCDFTCSSGPCHTTCPGGA